MRVGQLTTLGFIPLILIGLIGAGIAIANGGGAPLALTGVPALGSRPAEGTCRNCHSDFAMNDGTSLTLVGAPTFYVAGGTYSFSVQIASGKTAAISGRNWAFELTAVSMANGDGAGTFSNVAGQGTQIFNGTGQYATRQYVQSERTSVASPVEWQVQWTAPSTGAGQVGFFASGIAGDGGGGEDGDWSCTGSALMEDVTAIEAATWGHVKALYR